MKEWLDITPYVYGVSGRQWNDVPRQAEQLKKEHGEEVDAIVVLMGTNDFNSSVPVGTWFAEKEEQVMAARGETKKLETRKRRVPIMTNDTYKGRINIGLSHLKKLFPDKQIILLTPLHRSLAEFGEKNVQPDESYQNKCGEYVDAYVQAIKEGGMPVGTGGKAALLISGGIDSPVAGWMMAKRGVVLNAVHFASPPFTSPMSEMKVHDLLAKVAKYSGTIKLITVPFTEIQENIREDRKSVV